MILNESNPGVGNLLHLKSQIMPFVTIQNPAGAAKLPAGPKTLVIPKMIPKKWSLFTSKKSHNWGFKEPHVALEPHVVDPCSNPIFVFEQMLHDCMWSLTELFV